jgi:hypothetical protein
VRGARGTLFPVDVEGGDDPRFTPALRRCAAVLEQEGFGLVRGQDRLDLGAKLMEFLYVSRGAAGELEKRLNGTAAPLVSDEGGVDSYECAAVAHELRRKRGAAGAIVIAIDDANRVHIGMAVHPGTQSDLLAAKVMQQIDDVAHLHIQDVVLDLVVEEPTAAQPS